MTDLATRLSAMSEADLHFLAGALFARGKVYVGRSQRGQGYRYSPMLVLELTESLTGTFALLFDGPYERKYYGHTVLRYVLQDTHKIATLLEAIAPVVPDSWDTKIKAMIAFCRATSDGERVAAYSELQETP